MSRFFFSILCLMFFPKFIQASDGDWMNHCFQAAQYERKGEFSKTVEEYTKAMEILGSNRIANYLSLYIERGLAYTCKGYLEPKNYEKAIEDFNFVINHPQANQENIISALWNRAQVYLLSGKLDHFVKDIKNLEKIDPTIISYEESDEYVIFKMGNRLCRDKQVETSLIRTLMRRDAIHSEADIVFTSSGLGMIKKSKSLEFSKNAFFQEDNWVK
jgi:tetratricopeptide (TPR) repeat protein